MLPVPGDGTSGAVPAGDIAPGLIAVGDNIDGVDPPGDGALSTGGGIGGGGIAGGGIGGGTEPPTSSAIGILTVSIAGGAGGGGMGATSGVGTGGVGVGSGRFSMVGRVGAALSPAGRAPVSQRCGNRRMRLRVEVSLMFIMPWSSTIGLPMHSPGCWRWKSGEHW